MATNFIDFDQFKQASADELAIDITKCALLKEKDALIYDLFHVSIQYGTFKYISKP